MGVAEGKVTIVQIVCTFSPRETTWTLDSRRQNDPFLGCPLHFAVCDRGYIYLSLERSQTNLASDSEKTYALNVGSPN